MTVRQREIVESLLKDGWKPAKIAKTLMLELSSIEAMVISGPRSYTYREVVKLILQGLSNQDISQQLGITPAYVSNLRGMHRAATSGTWWEKKVAKRV